MKFLKKLLIYVICFSIIISSVTTASKKEVKAGVVETMALIEIAGYVVGSLTVYYLYTSGLEYNEANYKAQYASLCNQVGLSGYADGSLSASDFQTLSTNPIYANNAWSAYENQGETRDIGNIGDWGITFPELQAELQDIDVSNYDLWTRMVRKSANQEDPENDSYKFIKKLLIGSAVVLGGIGAFFTINPVTGEAVPVDSSLIDTTNANCYSYTGGGGRVELSSKSIDNSVILNTWSENLSNISSSTRVALYGYPNMIRFVKYPSSADNLLSGYRSIWRNGNLIENNTSQLWLSNANYPVTGFVCPMPVFNNYTEGYNYVMSGVGLENALNYKAPPTEEQLKAKGIHDLFQKALADSQLDLPINNVFQGVHAFIEDAVDKIGDVQDTVTPEIMPTIVDPIVDDLIEPSIPIVIDVPMYPNDPTFPEIPPVEEGELGGVLGTVFPFCIPFDLIYAIRIMRVEEKVPYFEIPISFPMFGVEYVFVLDLSFFEPLREVLHFFCIFSFILFLILATRRLIKG